MSSGDRETHGLVRTHILLVIALCAGACGRSAIVREQATVHRGAIAEDWRLEWRTPPKDACVPETAMDITCPCVGFSYGQRGILDLVRHRRDAGDERLPLTPFFQYGETPIYSEIPHDSTEAVLQRWPVFGADFSVDDRDELGRRVRKREAVSTLRLGDYDHDGQATEFVLQVGTLPCGKRESVLVGISAAHPALHAFSSIAHPDQPLVLEATIWEALLKPDTVTAVEWACGDHGGDTQTEVRIVVTSRGFDGVRSEYECGAHGKGTKLLSSSRL